MPKTPVTLFRNTHLHLQVPSQRLTKQGGLTALRCGHAEDRDPALSEGGAIERREFGEGAQEEASTMR